MLYVDVIKHVCAHSEAYYEDVCVHRACMTAWELTIKRRVRENIHVTNKMFTQFQQVNEVTANGFNAVFRHS